MRKFFDKNSVWFGIAVSIVSPVILFLILRIVVYYISLWTQPVLVQAYNQNWISDASVFLIAVIFNVVLFRKYLKDKKYERTGRGVLVSTTLLTFVFVLMKFNDYFNFF